MGSMHGMMISPDGVDEFPEGMSMHIGATPDRRVIVGCTRTGRARERLRV